jgi:hypothetical protein
VTLDSPRFQVIPHPSSLILHPSSFILPAKRPVNVFHSAAFIQLSQLDVAHCDIKIGRLATPPLETERTALSYHIT